MTGPEPLLDRVGALLGSPVVGWTRPPGGYSPADRRLVSTADGRRAFVKAATTPGTAEALRTEARVYAHLAGDYLPRRLAFDDGPPPLLLLEDLSAAAWPPPWTPARVAAVRTALDGAACAPPPPATPRLALADLLEPGWGSVARDPAPFLGLGLATAPWLERALPDLLRAAERAPVAGDALLHFDVRSDNLCFVGERAVLVDWSWAILGDPRIQLGFFAPSLAFEGGPRPDDLLPGEPGVAAIVAGYFAATAGLPEPFPGARVREIQRRQLVEALPWAVRALDLPDRPST